MKYFSVLTAFVLLLIVGCTPTEKINKAPKEEDKVVVAPPVEERNLEELVVTAPKKKEYKLSTYNPSYKREHDLLHTSIDVKFDWAKQHVLGKVTLELKPYFYASNKLMLDAKGFDFHKVAIVKADGSKADLKYDYDGSLITVHLDKKYEKQEKYKVFFDYTAKPNELKVGGSSAITQDKGLYFINPKGETKDKPMQIWTQGETEANSKWFPTVDKPNERCTQDITITVEDKYETLSNGDMISTIKNSDGTRTDKWVMDKPHAPYLFMMAIGDFAIVKDTWKGKEVGYYVEKDYEKHARAIFPYTVEMLEFFSTRLGYEYPWSKYSQVVVRDYVSGAMENTTGVIYGEFMQGTDRDLIDVSTNEKIVAHELIHHWFGDLVTCESWANLPLNESFANYGEYLWMEYKHGKDAADNHWKSEISGYMRQASRNRHQLIYYDYKDKEDTFDSHSYNKGGCILHMLRTYLGDEAFFKSLTLYLKTNEYTAVEAHELRLAFEEVTGQDLNWFFNQWFFAAGHPELTVDYTYDEATKKVTLNVEQTQNPDENTAIFQLPLNVDIYGADNKAVRENIWINKRKQSFTFDVASKPNLVNFDADRVLVGDVNYSKSTAEYVYQYHNAPHFIDRFESISELAKEKDKPEVQAVYTAALNDNFWSIRSRALQFAKGSEAVKSKLAVEDKHSAVRSAAIRALGETKDAKYADVAKNIIEQEKSYRVIAAALSSLTEMDNTTALQYAKKLENEKNTNITTAVGDIYVKSGDTKYLSFFENNWKKFNGFRTGTFLRSYGKLLQKGDEAAMLGGLAKLKTLAVDMDGSLWKRFAAARTVNDMKKFFTKGKDANPAYEGYAAKAKELIELIKTAEKSDQLKGLYSGW